MYDVTPYIRDIDSTLAEFKIRPNENSDFTQYSSSAFQFNASFDGSNSDYVPTLKDTVVNTETITLPDKDKSFIKVFVRDGQHNALNKMVTFPN